MAIGRRQRIHLNSCVSHNTFWTVQEANSMALKMEAMENERQSRHKGAAKDSSHTAIRAISKDL
ncbi:unnamed protein product [Prunus armeniaca]